MIDIRYCNTGFVVILLHKKIFLLCKMAPAVVKI